MKKVINEIKKQIKAGKQETEYVSPNYVSAISYRLKANLTSAEIVYISDNIEKLIN